MKRFSSKTDLWLLVLLVLVLLIQSFVLFEVLTTNTPISAKYMMIGSTVFVFTLIGSILLRTHYTVHDDQLTIACGPVTWTIKLSEITDVAETRSPLSSPALSLDRLRIRYAGRRSIMVSPDDKKAFLAAIGKSLS